MRSVTPARIALPLLLLAAAGCDEPTTPGPLASGMIVFVREVPTPSAGAGRFDFEIFRMGDGESPRNLTREPGMYDFTPAVSPDGRRIAFLRTADGTSAPDGHPAGLRIMNSDGSGLHAPPAGAGGVTPTWSPDGERIAFVDDVPGGNVSSALFVMDAAGAARSNLSARWALPAGQSVAEDVDPDWSPDGRWIAFTTSRGTLRRRIAVAEVDGTELRYVSAPPSDSVSDSEPQFSHDGRSIAFVRWTLEPNGNVTQDVWVVDLLGERNVTRGRAGVPLGHDWTPDDRLLVGSNGGILRFRTDGTADGVVVGSGRDPSVRP